MSTRTPAAMAAALVLSIAGIVAACSAAAPAATPSPSPVATPSPTPSLPAPSAGPSEAPSPDPSATPAAAAQLVLRVTIEGGFIGPAAHLGQLPVVAVYADGRIFTPAPVIAIYPAPLVPVESVRTVGPAGVAAIRSAISAAGLDAGGGTNPGIGADAADTVFSVRAGGRTIATRFPALGVGGHGPGQPGGSPDPQRVAALALLTRLTDAADTWGGPAADDALYVPAGYRLFVAPGAPVVADPAIAQRPVAWPLATPLASFGKAAVPDRGITGLRVGLVGGADAARLAPLLSAASQATPFTSGGASFTLYVTPLLPDETAG